MPLADSEVLLIGDDEVASHLSLSSPYIRDKIGLKFRKPKTMNIHSLPQCKFDAAIKLAKQFLHRNVDLLIILPFLWEYVELVKPSKTMRLTLLKKSMGEISQGLVKKVSATLSEWKEKFPNLIVFWCIPYVPFLGDLKFNSKGTYRKVNLFYEVILKFHNALCSTLPDIHTVDLHSCFFDTERQLKLFLIRRSFLYPPPQHFVYFLSPKRSFVTIFYHIIHDKYFMIKSKDMDGTQKQSTKLIWYDETDSYQRDYESRFDGVDNSSNTSQNPQNFYSEPNADQYVESSDGCTTNSSASFVSSLPTDFIDNIKDALDFINKKSSHEEKNVYEGYFSNFFNPTEWKDLFIKGDSRIAQDAILQCAHRLKMQRNLKGLQVLMVTLNRNFINATEEKILSSHNWLVGVNSHHVPDAPVILINTPAYLLQLISQSSSFTKLRNLSAILVFGDDLIQGQHSSHRQFLQLVYYILSKKKSAFLNKVIISDSGSQDIKLAAEKVLSTVLIYLNAEPEKGKNEATTDFCLFPSGFHPSNAFSSGVNTTTSALTIPLSFNKAREHRRRELSDIISPVREEENHFSSDNRGESSHSLRRLTIDLIDPTRRTPSPELIDGLPMYLFTLAHSYIPSTERKESEKENDAFMDFLKVLGRSIEKEYMTAGRRLLSEHEDNFKVYAKTPEIYPEFEEHYEVFAKKYEEHFGRFCDADQMQKAWLLFWGIIVVQIKEKAWITIKRSLQESLLDKYKEKHKAILDLENKYNHKGKRKQLQQNPPEADLHHTSVKSSRLDVAGSTLRDSKKSESINPVKKETNGAHALKSKNRTKIAFKLENCKPVPQFNLSEILADLELVSADDLGILSSVFTSLLDQSRELLLFNADKALAIFNEKDNKLLLDVISTKLNSLIESCSLAEKVKYRKAIAAVKSLKDKTKKDEDVESPEEDVDIIALAKATYGLTTERTYAFLNNTCSEKLLRCNGREQLFKEISLIHFKMATEM